MEILNLDEIVPTRKKLKLRGKSYDVLPFNLGAFIELTQLQSDEIAGKTPGEQIETAWELVSKFVPDLPRAEFNTLTMEQVSVVVDFLQQEASNEAKETGINGEESEGINKIKDSSGKS